MNEDTYIGSRQNKKQQFPPVAYKDPVSLNFINIEYYKNNCFYDGLKMALVLKVPFFDLLRS